MLVVLFIHPSRHPPRHPSFSSLDEKDDGTRRRRLMATTANWWRKRIWISNSSTRTSILVEEEIFGLATGGGGEFGLATGGGGEFGLATAVPHVVAALRGGRPFLPSIGQQSALDHDERAILERLRRKWRSARRTTLLWGEVAMGASTRTRGERSAGQAHALLLLLRPSPHLHRRWPPFLPCLQLPLSLFWPTATRTTYPTFHAGRSAS